MSMPTVSYYQNSQYRIILQNITIKKFLAYMGPMIPYCVHRTQQDSYLEPFKPSPQSDIFLHNTF
jgi:hypothetical protein